MIDPLDGGLEGVVIGVDLDWPPAGAGLDLDRVGDHAAASSAAREALRATISLPFAALFCPSVSSGTAGASWPSIGLTISHAASTSLKTGFSVTAPSNAKAPA